MARGGAGNLISDGTNRRYAYTAFNQLKSAQVDGVETRYGYDADGARVIKTGATGTTYTLGGLAEYEDTGGTPQLVREYVYLGGRLLASLGRAAVSTPSISVTLTSPVAGSTFSANQPIVLAAQPQVTSGSISAVIFYDGGTRLGKVTSAPWRWTLPRLAPGTHHLYAHVQTSTAAALSADTPITVMGRQQEAGRDLCLDQI